VGRRCHPVDTASPPPGPNDSAPLATTWVILGARNSPFLVPVRRSVKLPAASLFDFQNADRPTRAARNPPGTRGWVAVRFGTVPRRLGLSVGGKEEGKGGLCLPTERPPLSPSVELCISRPLRNNCEYQVSLEESVQTDINNRSADDPDPGTDA
jgi:hypothetical protein